MLPKFQLCSIDPAHGKQLIGHFIDQVPALALKKRLTGTHPQVLYVVEELKPDSSNALPNHPRWLVLNMGQGFAKMVAQLEPEFRFMAEALTMAMNAAYGPHFAMQEIKPGVNIRMRMPDPSRPGAWQTVSEGPMVASEAGVLIPKH